MKAIRRKVTVSLDPQLVSWADFARGPASRSRFIELAVTTFKRLVEVHESSPSESKGPFVEEPSSTSAGGSR